MGIFTIAGCGTPRETVTVAERPPASADSVTVPTEEPTAGGRAVVSIPNGFDTVQVGPFDHGKLWPLDQVPAEHFRRTYGVEPDSQWLEKAQKAALRFGDNCSASFASSRGLVLTNHHCAREAISRVGDDSARLLQNGFYADSMDAERSVPDLHVEQLVRIQDVTGRLQKPIEGPGDMRAASREQRINLLEEVMTGKAKRKDERLRVEIVGLHRGARYAAYTYRRYEDVRLVFAPELQVAFFGGEIDNFTYPRYSLDIAFFRVYSSDGEPLRPSHFFSWAEEGAKPGDPVFAVGNPGSTSRLEMLSQLEYKRDYRLPSQLEVFRSRRDLLTSYIANHPEEAVEHGLQNTLFTLNNSIKSVEGRLRGLRDPYLRARRGQAIQALHDSIVAVDSLEKYARTISEIERLQQSKRILAEKERAFLTFANLKIGSRILGRAVHGYYHDFLRKRGARPDRVQDIREEVETISDWPEALEEAFIRAQFEDIRQVYGKDHPTMRRLFRQRSPDSLAEHLVKNSALLEGMSFEKLMDDGYLKSNDPSVPVIEALAPLFLNVNRQMEDIRSTEESLNRRLSKARLSIFGDRVAPDATFTLRVSDGIVKGYRYNGTTAPPYTNFFGLYDRYYSHSQRDWSLPDRWIEPPDSLDLTTPLNIVSTADISGGSSGSPLLNKDLELVGVVFDGNMEALPNEYLYRDQAARSISVDVRAILESLKVMYDANRLVREITAQENRTAVNATSKLE